MGEKKQYASIMNKFIFDVDGTLTPSRGVIDKEFAIWFSKFCDVNDVYLVTGSDKPKTIEQIGEYIYHKCKRVYNCSGSDVWCGDLHISTNKWILPETPHEWLSEELAKSAFPLRTGLHFEHRPGMVNFSIVGRNADAEQRKKYRKWDLETEERVWIADKFNLRFPELEAKVGGETGIDIFPRGANKSQILQDFDDDDFIVFFGDRMDEDGNDYPLALVNYNGNNYHVKGWEETWEILRNEYSTDRQ
jgi:phosphomannomutase